MDPDWNDFKIILALARAGSVAGAARVLAIDQSTASRRLTALEEAVGARLVLRGGRELGWTEQGRAALSAAEAVEAAVSNATRAIRASKLEVVGAVRVSCSPGFLPGLLSLLPALREEHPRLTVELSGDYRRVDLAKGEADIALRMSRPTEPDLVARRSFEAGWGVFASTRYVAEHAPIASPAALSSHRLLLYAEAMHNVAPLCWLEDYRGPDTQFSRVDNLELAADIIADGGGIGVLPCFFAPRHPSLVRIFPEPFAYNTGFIVFHEAARDSARVRVVVDAMLAFFDAHAALYSGRDPAAPSHSLAPEKA